jgi:Oxidoreductase family, NAD-binding Rossmann fold
MVIIATPPGFRPIQYSTAIKAGKHVFMEKPCCVDAPGYRMLVEANKLADEKGHNGADSSFTACLGRMATYSGQVVKWDEAVEKGLDEAPEVESWDDKPPVEKNDSGDYPIPTPGVYKPFA